MVTNVTNLEQNTIFLVTSLIKIGKSIKTTDNQHCTAQFFHKTKVINKSGSKW